ncbi:hypothetical protein AA13595_1337 [Gluconacetobacter johannae DSM 13595]|nr:hypothetical protein AA13595_1337 [Gluconacetobacter johannae DSM 13595]
MNTHWFRLFSALFLSVFLVSCSDEHSATSDAKYPVQTAAESCAASVLQGNPTYVLSGVPYVVSGDTLRVGDSVNSSATIVTLPAVAIPSDGGVRGRTWQACMQTKGLRVSLPK